MEMIRIAVMQLQEAKNLQDQLKKQGVEIRLDHNDATCTRGCSITVEVLGMEKDFPVIAKVYQGNFEKLLEGHDVNFDVMNSVFDTSKDMAICPACGFEFSTGHKECPDCGLMLGF